MKFEYIWTTVTDTARPRIKAIRFIDTARNEVTELLVNGDVNNRDNRANIDILIYRLDCLRKELDKLSEYK